MTRRYPGLPTWQLVVRTCLAEEQRSIAWLAREAGISRVWLTETLNNHGSLSRVLKKRLEKVLHLRHGILTSRGKDLSLNSESEVTDGN
jgi:DNA-binding HxlR family transcriptional regulator